MSEPEDYDGKPEKAETFITQCTTYFLNNPEAKDSIKISCALSHMKTGVVLQFTENVCHLQNTEGGQQLSDINYVSTWDEFVLKFNKHFADKDKMSKAQAKLQNITPGRYTIDKFIIEFKQYEQDTHLDDTALLIFFKKVMPSWIFDQITKLLTIPTSLTKWKKYTLHFDRNKQEQEEFKRTFGH